MGWGVMCLDMLWATLFWKSNVAGKHCVWTRKVAVVFKGHRMGYHVQASLLRKSVTTSLFYWMRYAVIGRGARLGKTSRSLLPPPTRFPKSTPIPKPILVPTPIQVLNPIDYMPKFMVPFIENVVDVIGDENCGFRAIAEFLELTEESHIMVRRHLIQEVKNHRNDYVGVFAGEDRYNYILNDLHPPTNSGGIALVNKLLTLLDMGQIVANYYNRLVVLLTNHEIGTSESFFQLRGVPPAKQKIPAYNCPLPPSSTELNNHRSNEALTWEFEYLDQHVRFRDVMKIEKDKDEDMWKTASYVP
ncbi:hypothetical protein MTR_2g461930 [Medicago truncatula]|uniref:OTU domain-containing protein n=1 Tax=Medicago truncatula TaxID=3880 RepID=A0A072V7V1_MEDTR|nr:hypothetical protein MTR_2g461930 [Medicago truncatula]